MWVKESTVSQLMESIFKILSRPHGAKWKLRFGSRSKPFIPKHRNYKVCCSSIFGQFWTLGLKLLHVTLATQYLQFPLGLSPVNTFSAFCLFWQITFGASSVKMNPVCGRKCETDSEKAAANRLTVPHPASQTRMWNMCMNLKVKNLHPVITLHAPSVPFINGNLVLLDRC